ncbi:hypothetical protein APHAL10511_007169 [Amanita phalloides]|nr:hypothetical protein APHAL10511_007169 [Amanita phalloides]
MAEPTKTIGITHTLSSQVGGHEGVLTSEDDSLIIKPALPLEVAFYQRLNFDPAFTPLRPFVPNFIGTLRLEGELIQRDGDIEQHNIRTASDKADESWMIDLVPNVMDIKLGTVLYDEVDAPPHKREKMIAMARDTTSLETGIRLTGFQVYDHITDQPVVTPKTYGKSINQSQLPEGIARFFPIGSKEEGESSLGLPIPLLLPILDGLKEDVAEIREIVAALEMRIVGSSLLIVYEGDWALAEEALKRTEEEEEEEVDDEGSDDDEEKPGPPYVVKLIDFAHTRITPGRGPDKSVLTGLDTVLRFTRDSNRCATDDLSLSPKTNSASHAGCGIASLASQGQIIPSSDHPLRGGELWTPSFLEGTALNQRTCGLTDEKNPTHSRVAATTAVPPFDGQTTTFTILSEYLDFWQLEGTVAIRLTLLKMASTTADTLLSLRQAIKKKNPITYANNDSPCDSLLNATDIAFGLGSAFPKSASTRLRKPGVTTSSDVHDFYSLEAVYLAWLLRDAPGAEYMKQARENGLAVGFVSVTERKNVVDWLEGKLTEYERILPLAEESTTPPGSPPRRSLALSSVKTQPSTSSPSKRRYVADHQDAEVVKRIKQSEVELRDRNSVLRGIKPNNFSAVRTASTEKLKKLKEASKAGSLSTPSSAIPDPKMQPRKARHNDPIIIISSSPTALITMHNVKRFLQESTFEPTQEAKARAAREGNTRPEDVIPLYRKRVTINSSGKETESQARYFVVDNVEALAKFGADAWERVVCVMTTGQAWQFKPYKWNEPTQLFHHVKGIYVCWSNDPPNTKIKDWNVTELKIDPHRRHVDKSVVAHFWKTLDGWILANKPWLLKG